MFVRQIVRHVVYVTCTVAILAGLLFSNTYADVPAAFLSDVETHVLDSKIHKERKFQLSVALPLSYASSPNARYPVIYSLDANGEFGLIAETARMLAMEQLIPDAIVVGLGYPTGGHFMFSIKYRELDYTPTVDEKLLEEYKAQAGQGVPDLFIPAGNGGGVDFLAFIRDQIIPFIDGNYRTNPDDRTLLGHSLGGLFTFYAAFTSDGLFNRYVIGSPSLWWDNRALFEVEENYAKNHQALKAKIFMGAGSDDSERVVSTFKAMTDILGKREYQDLNLIVHTFPDETHISVLPAFVSRGLRSVFGKSEFAAPNCAPPAMYAGMNISVPCVAFNGNQYRANLLFTGTGFTWKADPASVADSNCPTPATPCASLDGTLGMTIKGLNISGAPHDAVLSRFINEADPSGLYWQAVYLVKSSGSVN